jgi:hypothetical protein
METWEFRNPDRERAVRIHEILCQEGHPSNLSRRGEVWVVTCSYPGPIAWLDQKMKEKYPDDWASLEPVSLLSALRLLLAGLFRRR